MILLENYAKVINMEIFVSLKNLIKRINVIDKKAHRMSQNQNYTSNPFAFTKNKTYVWMDKEENPNCKRNNE